MTNKEKYKQWCENNNSMPLFYRYDYYQSILGDNWDVVLDVRDQQIAGCLPYVIQKKYGFKRIRPEFLFPYQGIWINYPPNQKYTTKLGYEKEVCQNIINQLPKVAFFDQKFHPLFTNFLPFYWKGFQQTARFSYIINDISNLDVVFENFNSSTRGHIRKAEKTISISSSDNIELAFNMNFEYFKRKKVSPNIDKNRFFNSFNYAKKNNCGELLVAKDKENNVHSMCYYIWDEFSAYCLISVTDEKYKRESSMSLMYWEAIKRASARTKSFNFNGGMIESIETFFRSYGGTQTHYFEIKKTNHPLLKLLRY